MMWPLWALKALGVMKRIPWQAYAALGAAILILWLRADAYDDGRESVFFELRDKQAKVEEKAKKAVSEAEKQAAKREAVQAAEAAAQIKAIEDAEANDENALDALF